MAEVVQNDPDLLKELYKVGSDASEEILVASLELCSGCAKYNEQLTGKLIELMSRELMYPVPLFKDNPIENQNTYKTLARGLVTCAKNYPNYSRKIIQQLLDYLIGVYCSQSPDIIVRDEVISCLCDIIHSEMNQNGIESIKWVLDSLSQSLYTIYGEYMRLGKDKNVEGKKEKENRLIVIVVSLGRIACQLNDKDVSDIVVPNLINRITYPDLNFDAFIIDQLTEIALTGQQDVYSQVADLLVNIYKNCLNYPDNMFIHDTIPNAFSRLACGLDNTKQSNLRQDLLIRILKLFQLIANQIYRKEPKQRTAVLGFLGILLPIIGELMNNRIKDHSSSNTKLYSNVWYYCVIYRFAYEREWTQDWFTGIKQIAKNMPPLTAEKSTTVLETTLTLESFNMSNQEITVIKRELSEIISRSGQNKSFLFSQDSVRSMTFGKCLYLLSVFHLETLRARSGSMLPLFSYLAEQSYRSDLPMSQAVSIIADQVFSVFLGKMNSKEFSSSSTREPILIDLIYALLLAFVHNDDTVRKAADKYILQLLDAFPQLLWNSKALTTLLDLTQAVNNGADIQGHATLRLNLPNSEETITLPEDFSGRKSLLADIKELCRVWLQSANKYAPVETNSVLQEYCQQFQRSSFGFLHHQGFFINCSINIFNN